MKYHQYLGALLQVKLSIALPDSSRKRFNGINCYSDNNIPFWSMALRSIPPISPSASLLACQPRQSGASV